MYVTPDSQVYCFSYAQAVILQIHISTDGACRAKELLEQQRVGDGEDLGPMSMKELAGCTNGCNEYM